MKRDRRFKLGTGMNEKLGQDSSERILVSYRYYSSSRVRCMEYLLYYSWSKNNHCIYTYHSPALSKYWTSNDENQSKVFDTLVGIWIAFRSLKIIVHGMFSSMFKFPTKNADSFWMNPYASLTQVLPIHNWLLTGFGWVGGNAQSFEYQVHFYFGCSIGDKFPSLLSISVINSKRAVVIVNFLHPQ